jgi:hypothetical protein
MPAQYHVYGPTKVYLGGTTATDGTEIGQSDGQVLITIEEVQPYKEITTDGAGGEAVDFIQLQGHAIVVVTFISWDDAELDKLIAPLTSAGAPATRGNTGAVGMLRVADNATAANQRLRITGTKITAANGAKTIMFPRCFRDPNSPTRNVDIGVEASKRSIVLRANADGSGNYYTLANITA